MGGFRRRHKNESRPGTKELGNRDCSRTGYTNLLTRPSLSPLAGLSTYLCACSHRLIGGLFSQNPSGIHAQILVALRVLAGSNVRTGESLRKVSSTCVNRTLQPARTLALRLCPP